VLVHISINADVNVLYLQSHHLDDVYTHAAASVNIYAASKIRAKLFVIKPATISTTQHIDIKMNVKINYFVFPSITTA
jgi:hypothetical protein